MGEWHFYRELRNRDLKYLLSIPFRVNHPLQEGPEEGTGERRLEVRPELWERPAAGEADLGLLSHRDGCEESQLAVGLAV